MQNPASPAPTPPSLPDPWDQTGEVPLDGPLERANLHPALAAIVWPLLALILFFLISQVAALLLLAVEGVDFDALMEDFGLLLRDYTGTLLMANTVGQVLGLALPVVALMWLHSSRPAAFMRFRTPDVELTALAFLGWMALIPLVSWLGEINQYIPLPEVFHAMEEQQMALIEQVLLGDLGVVFTLAMIAVTPAICEELLFRGYTQRQAERAFGIVVGILFSGILFAIYHLRLTQILPLAALGIYLAYLAWRTGNLWIPIVIHFANNAYAVFLGAYARQADVEWTALEQMTLPWYLVLLGAVLFVGVIAVLHARAQARLETVRSYES